MKIYEKIITNIETGKIVYEKSFEYPKNKPIAWCGGGGGTTVQPPQPTPEEIALQKLQLEMLQGQQADMEKMRPFILKAMGLRVDSDGNIVQMTDEERREGMTPEQLNAYELLLAQQERQSQAMAGELPLSPALEKELTGQRSQMEEALAQRLGPNWMSTTAGQQAITAFDEKASLVKDEASRGQLQSGAGLALMQAGALGDVSNQAYQKTTGFAGGRGGLLQMAGQAQQPYQQQRQWQHQANIAGAQNRAGRQAGFMGGMGSLLGSGLTAAGMIWSSKVLKKSIKTITVPLEKIAQIRGVTFDWKDESGHDTGVIAEEVEGVVPGLVGEIDGVKGVYYHKIIPILVEALKEQQKQIDELRRI